MPIEKIVSGGQTGVDRATLDVAIELGIPHGGWVPAGRLAEDGIMPECYNVLETPSSDPAQRTEWNVRDADATLIISNGRLIGGSQLTLEMAKKYEKHYLHIDLSVVTETEAINQIKDWLNSVDCKVLNVAGPRNSEDLEIYQNAKIILSNSLVTMFQHSSLYTGVGDPSFRHGCRNPASRDGKPNATKIYHDTQVRKTASRQVN